MLTNLLVLEKIYIAVSYEPTLRENFPYSELFWAEFSRIRTEYGEILRISPHSVQMRENVDQNNSKYGHFSCSANRNLSQTIADDFRLSYWYCYASICQSFCLYL